MAEHPMIWTIIRIINLSSFFGPFTLCFSFRVGVIESFAPFVRFDRSPSLKRPRGTSLPSSMSLGCGAGMKSGIACLKSLEMEGAKVEAGDLESSLIQIIQEHQQRAVHIQDQADKAKKDALRTAVQVSELLVDTINGGVEDAFTNEKHIEFEIRTLIGTIIRYKKQTNQWLAASHALNSVLKEIGDFENWMKTMDLDCKSINAVIRNIHQA